MQQPHTSNWLTGNQNAEQELSRVVESKLSSVFLVTLSLMLLTEFDLRIGSARALDC